VYRVLTGLGYFLGLEKCISSPATRLQYLGMLIDTNEQAFIVPQDNQESRTWSRSDVDTGFEKRAGILGVFRRLG